MYAGPHAVHQGAVRGDGGVEIQRGHHHRLPACAGGDLVGGEVVEDLVQRHVHPHSVLVGEVLGSCLRQQGEPVILLHVKFDCQSSTRDEGESSSNTISLLLTLSFSPTVRTTIPADENTGGDPGDCAG